MERRPVEIKVISASGIKDVNKLSKMDVYVIASVSGDPRSVQRSPIDKDGGVNPRWHHYEMKFTVDEAAAQHSRIGFVFQIMSNRTLGDKESGRVYIPVKELLDRYEPSVAGIGTGSRGLPHSEVEYQVRTPSGKLRGTFRFSYAFGEKFTQKTPLMDPQMGCLDGPGYGPNGCLAVVQAYPYPGYQGGVGAAPQPVAGGGGGSGSRFGVGTAAGAGIGVGLLGGLLIGEMVDDVADM